MRKAESKFKSANIQGGVYKLCFLLGTQLYNKWKKEKPLDCEYEVLEESKNAQ